MIGWRVENINNGWHKPLCPLDSASWYLHEANDMLALSCYYNLLKHNVRV